MSILADVYVPLVLLASAALAYAAYRLNKRVSRGAIDAGPREREPQKPPGLKATPWELGVIDEQLLGAGAVSQDLATTINRLLDAAELNPTDHNRYVLTGAASVADVEQTVAMLEDRLELGPVDPNYLN